MAHEVGVSSIDDCVKRQTFAASPAEPGASLIGPDEVIEWRNDPIAYRLSWRRRMERSEGAGIGSQEGAAPSSRHSHATEAEPIARRRSDCRDARRAGRTAADLIGGRHDGSSSALSTALRVHDWLPHSLAGLFDRNRVVHRRLEDALAPDRQLQLDDGVFSDRTPCAVPFSYSARSTFSHTATCPSGRSKRLG